VRERAASLPPGAERDELTKKVRQAENALRLEAGPVRKAQP
jgi:hypothetical protein